MAQEKITIKFEPKGHSELIKALNNLAKAQENVKKGFVDTKAKVTALNPKMLEISTSLKAQGKDWTALGISVKVGTLALKNNKNAVSMVNARLKTLSKTTKGAALKADLLGTRNNRLAATNSKLAMSFATLRSKLLLLTFAMSMGGRQAIQMVKDFAKVEAMSVAFDTLSGGAGNAKIALTQLSGAVGGTMSKFDLLQSANNALILGVAKSSEEMNTMFGVAVKLGRAVGRTAKDSVDSLVTGIGRQSRMMLDNIGIIMSTEKAYSAYAAELGVTVESLNETERRQAFLNATLEAAKEKADMLGDGLETMQSKLEGAGAAWDDLQVATGKFITVSLDLDKRLESMAYNFGLLTRAIDDNQELTEKDWLVVQHNVLSAILKVSPTLKVLAKDLGINTDKYIEQAAAISDLGEEENILFKVKKVSTELELKMLKLTSETTNAKLRALDAQIDEVKANKDLFATGQDYLDVLAMLEKQYKTLDPAEKERVENLKKTAKAMKQSKKDFDAAVKAVEDSIVAQEKSQQEFENMFPTLEEYSAEMSKKMFIERANQEVLRQWIANNQELAASLGIETDATKEARKAREELNETTKETIEGENAYRTAINNLDMAKIKGKALDDGIITNQEKLIINKERLSQANFNLEKAEKAAIGANDPALIDAQTAALNELSSATQERVGIVKDIADVEQKALDDIAAAREKAIQTTISQFDAEAALALALKEKELLLDGEIDRADQLVLVNMQLAEAEMKLAQAINLGDTDAQAAAQANVNKLKQEGIDLTNKELEQLATIQDVYSEAYSAISDMAMANQSRIMDGIRSQTKAEIDGLKKTNEYKRASESQQAKMEEAIRKKREGELVRAFRMQQLMQVGQVWMNIALAITRQFATGDFWAAIGKQTYLMAMGGIQSAVIMAQQPPKMATGGLIGGRRHSQGGTMIEAEQGEFIMSRSAVQSVGIENLNRMNEGGGSSSVTVNVSGNVMTEQFTEEQIIPALKEALRRGENLDHSHGSKAGMTVGTDWE